MPAPADTAIRIDASHHAGERVGLVAAWGQFPREVIRALRRQGHSVYCLGVVGHADPGLAQWCDDFTWIGFGQLGRAIRYFRRHGVTRATMAGKIHKTVLFRPAFLVRSLPDWRTIRAFAPHWLSRRRDNRDDSLLGTLVDQFAADGIRFGPATDYAPELLVKQGQLTRRAPSAWQWKDILFGWRIAKELGRLDVGQSVVVKDQAVLALEAVEGTDACIRRAGPLCPSGGFTVVKTAKPQQDMRFDVPTVGVGTLESMVAAGASVLAVEADRTILLAQDDFIAFANRHRLAIVALEEARIRSGEYAAAAR